MTPDPGETTAFRTIGRYRAFGELGRGAMGVVYRGFDPIIGRTVALKTLSLDSDDTQIKAFRERLYREAAAAGALSHPNIVTIYDIVEDGGLTAVAMEFIEGRSLAAIIAERAPLPMELAVEILDHICSALDYAGSQGIVHRDIKPANILVTTGGRAKVTDFGVARLALSTMTQAGTVLGSPSYMSPEQVRGLSLDGRSDLFSAAVVFFEMITRERPFTGNDIATTMYRIAHEPPTPPSQFNPAIGLEIASVLERAFAKSPADRFQSGADLVAELRAAAALGSTRGSSSALAALAAAPPPVPPIVSPVIDLPDTAVAAPDDSPSQGAPVPVTGAAASVRSGSGGHALAPIPGSGISPAAPPVSLEGASLALPTIPLPPEPVGPAAQRPLADRPAKAKGHGLALAGIAGVVVLGVVGAMFLRGGSTPSVEAPPATVAGPPPPQPAGLSGPVAAPAGPVDAPGIQVPPAPSAPVAPAAGTRAPLSAPPRVPAGSSSRPGARPMPSPPAPSSTPVAAPQLPTASVSPGTKATSARVYLTTEVDVKPGVVTQVAPQFPEDAAKQNVRDVVILQVLVDTGGRPETIKVLRGSRKAASLDAAAVAAVRQWTFNPAKKNGQPVPCWFNVGVPFPPVK